jgi:hypothetical protein
LYFKDLRRSAQISTPQKNGDIMAKKTVISLALIALTLGMPQQTAAQAGWLRTIISSALGKPQAAKEEQQASAQVAQVIDHHHDGLEATCREMIDEEILCAVGIGKAKDRKMASNMSSTDARRAIAFSIETVVKATNQQSGQSVDGETKEVYTTRTTESTNQMLKGSVVYDTRTLSVGNQFEVHTLMVVKPEVLKKALASNKELEGTLDSANAKYEAKYSKKKK